MRLYSSSLNPSSLKTQQPSRIKLAQGERQHCIGRLRLSITDAAPPVPLPPQYPVQAGSALIKGTIPPTGGGILVLWGGKNLDLLAASLAGKAGLLRFCLVRPGQLEGQLAGLAF